MAQADVTVTQPMIALPGKKRKYILLQDKKNIKPNYTLMYFISFFFVRYEYFYSVCYPNKSKSNRKITSSALLLLLGAVVLASACTHRLALFDVSQYC